MSGRERLEMAREIVEEELGVDAEVREPGRTTNDRRFWLGYSISGILSFNFLPPHLYMGERSIVKVFRGTRLLLCLLSKYLGVSYGDVVALALDACGDVSPSGGGSYVKILLPSHLAVAVKGAAEARRVSYAGFLDALIHCFAERLATENPRFAEALRRFKEDPQKICKVLSRV